jgi:hypothetical protein
MPECQSGDAGANPADRTIFSSTRRAPAIAQQSLQNFSGLGAAPRRRATFQNCGVAKRQGNGLISRLCAGSSPAPATTFPKGRSIIQEVTRLASGRARCKAVAVHHFHQSARPSASRPIPHLHLGGKVENPESLISSSDRGATPRPATIFQSMRR